jgi:hypothetical protein
MAARWHAVTTDPWDVIGDLPVEPNGEPADICDGDCNGECQSCVETGMICNACGTSDCRELPALVPLVRAFLPDWNPDTEETP